MGIASIWTGLGLRTSGPDHRAPWRGSYNTMVLQQIPTGCQEFEGDFEGLFTNAMLNYPESVC